MSSKSIRNSFFLIVTSLLFSLVLAKHAHCYQNDDEYENGYSNHRGGRRPQQIALLVPLTGSHQKAAEAVKEGVFAARNDSAGNPPEIKVYDTNGSNIRNLYFHAVDDGADFVIGPLKKEDVLELSLLSPRDMKAPILALNTNDRVHMAPPQFYQFSLAPESEAEQIALKVWNKNLRSPAILVPNNEWGQRIITAFKARWQELGGQSVTTVKISSGEDLNQSIRKLLGVDISEKRANAVKNALQERVNFEPRRRQDLDVIVMASPPEQARQVKPLLNFYYAHNLPVYATSSVYSGRVNPAKDQDLNGIIFCDSPWLLLHNAKANAARAMIQEAKGGSMYSRLFAMGLDAYSLSTQVEHMNSSYQGATGYLSVGPNHVIDRELVWAKFENGAPRTIE